MYMWGSFTVPATAQPGVHYFNASQYGDSNPNLVIASTTKYTYPGTNSVDLYDYRLDASGGVEASQLVASYTATTPFRYVSAVSPNGNINVLYQVQQTDGTSSLIQATYDPTLSSLLSRSTVASGIVGAFDQGMQSANRTANNISYAVGWEAYNASSATQDIYLRIFKPDGTAYSGVVDAVHLTGITTAGDEAQWRIRNAGGTYELAHTATANDGHKFIQFNKYNLDGSLNNFSFSVDHGSSSISAVDFQQVSSSISSSTQYIVAFSETTAGGANQVTIEGLDINGNLLSTVSFGTSGPGRVDLRSNGTNGYVVAYGNSSGEHLVQLDLTGHQVGSIVDIAQPQVAAEANGQYGALTTFGDGRFGILNNVLGSDGVTSQTSIQIYDTRTTGVSIDHSSGTSGEQIAGTAFDDTIKGGSGNDLIAAAGGSDILSGGAGDDTVVLNYNLTQAKISFDAAGNVILDGPNNAHEVLSGFEHFRFADGTVNEHAGSALVDDLFYSITNNDVWNAKLDATTHYNQYGWHEGRDPDALFSTNGYLAANADVAKAGLNPLAHYDQYGWKEGRDPSVGFDNEQYLARNPDVKAAGLDPLAHYLQYGQAEGRQAYAAIGKASDFNHGSFDAEYYLLANPDVAKAALASGGDTFAFAYQHFDNYGWHEGRMADAYFDSAYYLAHNPDVAAAGIDPLTHYDQYGWHEGRDPSASFHTNAYLAANPDVAAAGIDPLTHYLQYGADEGRHLA